MDEAGLLPTAALVFAAGFGTRMGELTRNRPKPLIPVAGRALIDRALDLAQAEASRIVVNTHYLGDQVAEHLQTRKVILSPEVPDILDTGGGLRAALPLLGSDPVFTLNPDAVWTGRNPLTTLRTGWQADRMQALLLLVPSEKAKAHPGSGDFSIGEDGRLTRNGDLVFSGAQITRTGRLSEIAEPVFSLNRLWDLQAGDGGLFGIIHTGGWCDVGHPAALPLAEAMLAND